MRRAILQTDDASCENGAWIKLSGDGKGWSVGVQAVAYKHKTHKNAAYDTVDEGRTRLNTRGAGHSMLIDP